MPTNWKPTPPSARERKLRGLVAESAHAAAEPYNRASAERGALDGEVNVPRLLALRLERAVAEEATAYIDDLFAAGALD